MRPGDGAHRSALPNKCEFDGIPAPGPAQGGVGQASTIQM